MTVPSGAMSAMGTGERLNSCLKLVSLRRISSPGFSSFGLSNPTRMMIFFPSASAALPEKIRCRLPAAVFCITTQLWANPSCKILCRRAATAERSHPNSAISCPMISFLLRPKNDSAARLISRRHPPVSSMRQRKELCSKKGNHRRRADKIFSAVNFSKKKQYEKNDDPGSDQHEDRRHPGETSFSGSFSSG